VVKAPKSSHITHPSSDLCSDKINERIEYEVDGLGSVSVWCGGMDIRLKKSDRNRIESFEMWCWRKMLEISWKEHRTNISILEEIGLERELMGKLARMKLQYFGHVTRGSAGNLALTVLEGNLDGLSHSKDNGWTT